MFKSEEPFSPEITPQQFQEFESKIKEYFLLTQMIRKTQSEIFEVATKGVKDLHEAVQINEEGIKLVEQLTILKAEQTNLIQIEKEFDRVKEMAIFIQEDFQQTFAKKK